MDRADEIKTHIGLAAYEFYGMWMKAYNRSTPTIETFSTSRYYKSFINFAEYVKTVNIYRPDKFIGLMKEKDISPQLWLRAELYEVYCTWLDRISDPLEQAGATAEIIFKLAIDVFHCTTGEVFDLLKPREIIQLVRERKLSMFLLLCSQKFKDKLKTMEDGDLQEIVKLMNQGYYAERFEKDQNLVDQLKAIATELKI
jgi:hypothetical protein